MNIDECLKMLNELLEEGYFYPQAIEAVVEEFGLSPSEEVLLDAAFDRQGEHDSIKVDETVIPVEKVVRLDDFRKKLDD